MITKKDLLFLSDFVSKDDIVIKKDTSTQKLVEYEKKYEMNSFDAYFSFSTDEDVINWKKKIEKFILENEDFTKINKIKPVSYRLIKNPNKEMLFRLKEVMPKDETVVFFVEHYNIEMINILNNFNSIVVIVDMTSKTKVLFNETMLNIMYLNNNIKDVLPLVDTVYVDKGASIDDKTDKIVAI